jgi:hypothetical protein
MQNRGSLAAVETKNGQIREMPIGVNLLKQMAQ